MKKSSTPILFGTDPEVFAVYSKNDNLYALPPYFFRHYLNVPASDDKRHPVFFETPVGKFHEDGAAFEMAILPSHNPKDLFDRIHEVIAEAEEKIISKFPEYCEPKLVFNPTVNFEVERWADEGKEFRMSTEFGCDPDLDAFNVEKSAQVIDASLHPFRYGGGHLHISGSPFIEEDPILAVQLMAITAGCAAIAYSDTPDLDRERTYLYGRPGKYRIQSYGKRNTFGPEYAVGIEYRTPSNRWISSWGMAEKIFQWSRIAIEQLLPNKKSTELVNEVGKSAIKAILTADQAKAKSVLEFVSASI